MSEVIDITPGNLDSSCASSSLAFLMMYFAYKLNNQGDNIQPWCTPLELVCCSMSSSNYCFLTCIRISQEAVQLFWYSHLLKNFLQFVVIHTIKGFGIVYKAEVDVFLELFCFFNDPANGGNLISGSSAFSKSIWTSGSSQFTDYWNLALPESSSSSQRFNLKGGTMSASNDTAFQFSWTVHLFQV